jgi:hypothetical protein
MIRRPRRAALAWMAVMLMSLSASQGAERFRPAPHFEGAEIPDPPEQGKPWTPPETKLPRFLVRATATLADQGLADPRGCDYREVEVAAGNVWSGDGGVASTHGWVLPEREGDASRFVVCWNGLVYPAIKVGKAADLEADIRGLARTMAEGRASDTTPGRGRAGFGESFYGAFSEGRAVAVDGRLPLKVCLLLLAGRADLAEVLWASGTDWTPDGPKLDLTNYGISYLTLALDWTWGLFDRTICAQMRGDDRLALIGARLLLAAAPRIEAKASEMGFARQRGFQNRGSGTLPYIDFLAQLPELAADQERRAKEPKRGPVPPPGADRPARIAALIRDLDLVAARQSGQPGGVGLGESPIVQDLIKEGEDAVEPLLSALENDHRLTRTVSFGRDFHRGRSIHDVSEAAFIALGGILRTSAFGENVYADLHQGDAGRRRLAASIRAYWEKNRNLPLTERWYRTLADDRATPEQWLQAAGNLVQPTDYETTFGSVWVLVPPKRKPGVVVLVRGESLRGKRDPSVADLMAKRVDDLARKVRADPSPRPFDHQAAEMALMLSKWSPAEAVPVLTRQFGNGRDQFHRLVPNSGNASYVAATLARLTSARVRVDDPKALDDYADWLVGVAPKTLEYNMPEALEPMIKNPDHPAVLRAAGRMFGDPASSWLPLINDQDKGATNVSHEKSELLGTELIGVAPFRARVIAELKDRTRIGIATVSDSAITVSVGSNGSRTSYSNSDGAATIGEYPFRVCDFVASRLADRIDGTPLLKFYWPEARRDAAIAECVAYLERYGARFAHSPQTDELPDRIGQHRLPPVFPPLDHPATADEVRRGLAIFSVEGEGEVRLVPMPARPLKAKWVTLKDYPSKQDFYSADTGAKETRTVYDQEGFVWQAEEVQKNGQWERFYGFAGRRLAKVPAAEIEFAEDWFRWGALSNRLDARVELARIGDKPPSVGEPVEVIVRVRNRSGLEQKVPTEFLRTEGLPRPALRRGIELKVSFVADDPKRRTGSSFSQGLPKGEPLAPRRLDRFDPGDPARRLGPADSFEAFRIDLNDWFAIDRPGTYRIQVKFTNESGVAEGASNEITIPITERPTR